MKHLALAVIVACRELAPRSWRCQDGLYEDHTVAPWFALIVMSRDLAGGKMSIRRRLPVVIAIVAAALYVASASAQRPQKWHRVEADNGAAFAIDLNSITRMNNGAVDTIVCTLDGDACNLLNQSRMRFDCRGHYMDIDRGGGLQMAPPRSVAGRLAAIACVGARDSRLDVKPTEPPNPADYCQGFAAEACQRMRSVIDSRIKPAFCKPGFALTGSGLSAEQLRICYVMSASSR